MKKKRWLHKNYETWKKTHHYTRLIERSRFITSWRCKHGVAPFSSPSIPPPSRRGALLKNAKWRRVDTGGKDWCDLILKSFLEDTGRRVISIGGSIPTSSEWKLSKDSSEARRRFDVRLCEVDRRMDRANERKLGREGRGRRVCYVKRLRMEKGGRLLLETGAWSGLRTR